MAEKGNLEAPKASESPGKLPEPLEQASGLLNAVRQLYAKVRKRWGRVAGIAVVFVSLVVLFWWVWPELKERPGIEPLAEWFEPGAATPTAATPRAAISFPTTPTNSIGNASNNTGIITQGQTGGQNTIIQAPKKHVRHLSAADKKTLIRIFTPLAPAFPQLRIGAPMDGEARGYAKEFADVFNQIGIKVPHIYIVFPTSAKEDGSMGVLVKDIHNPQPLAETFFTAMREAGFPVKPGILETADDGDFQLVIF